MSTRSVPAALSGALSVEDLRAEERQAWQDWENSCRVANRLFDVYQAESARGWSLHASWQAASEAVREAVGLGDD